MPDVEAGSEYFELLQELVAVINERARRAHRALVDRQRVQQAVKPPEWAPREKKDWADHLELKDDQGQRVGFVDAADELVSTMTDQSESVQPGQKSDPEAAEVAPAQQDAAGQSELVNVAGDLWLQADREAEPGQLRQARRIEEEQAVEWMESHGWDVIAEQSTLDEEEQIEASAVFVDSAEVQVPDSVEQVVARDAHIHTDHPERVQVAGMGAVNDHLVTGWDEIAPPPGEPAPAGRGWDSEQAGQEEFLLEQHTGVSAVAADGSRPAVR